MATFTLAGMTSAGIHRYRQVADDLRKQIRTGRLKPGEQIPAEPDLIARYGFDRTTVRRGIALLRQWGLLTVVHGKGTFVTERRHIRRDLVAGILREHALVVQGAEPDEGMFAAVTQLGDLNVDVPTEYAWLERPPPDVCEAFGVSEDTRMLCRVYRYLVDGALHQVSRSYLLADMVAGTPVEDISTERPGLGVLARLRSIGVTGARVEWDVHSRIATPEEAVDLDVSEGAPVFGIRRLLTDSGGRVVEVGDTTAPGDRLTLHMTVTLPGDQR